MPDILKLVAGSPIQTENGHLQNDQLALCAHLYNLL